VVIPVGHEPNPAKRIRLTQAKRLIEMRHLRGITQQELADRIAAIPGFTCTKQAVCKWESGAASPRAHMQVAIAQVLDVPVSLIFGLDGEAVA